MDGIRSILFVPAVDRRLAKIGKTNADAYIIDLEDSIADSDKEEALIRIEKYLETNNVEHIFVRINKNRCKKELNVLRRYNVGIMLPKFQVADDYSEMADILKQRDVIALIESPQALINAGAIAAVPWVTALAFGAEDYTVAANMLNSYENLYVPKCLLAIAVKANQKKIYDTPCFHISDEDIFQAELQQAVNLGYDGKLSIHPKQINGINQAFGEILNAEYMRYVVAEYEASGNAVCEIDGVVYEKFHINRLKRMLAPDKNAICGKEANKNGLESE